MSGVRLVGTGLALVALSTMTACGSTGTPEAAVKPASGASSNDQTSRPVVASLTGKKICFGFQALETEFWAAGVQSISTSLRAAGAQVIEKNSNEDANKQLEQVKDCITQKVDGIIIIPQDGESAVKIAATANAAGIPIGIFNRPPANYDKPALVSVADNRSVAKQTMEYMATQAAKMGRKVQPLILVGDLGDPNAIERKNGFYDVISANPDVFLKPIEVETKWDAATAQANLQSAMQANPDVDLLFTSSDFMYPQIKSVLNPLGKWKKIGQPGHIIMGGVDGDNRACGLMKDKYIDATGVQDLFVEADNVMTALADAITKGEKTPAKKLIDPGFALTQGNIGTKEKDMWGCVITPPK